MHNHPSLPLLGFTAAHADCQCENTSSLKFISMLLISWCISMSGNIGQRLAHPAPKSLHCPQQGREMRDRGVLSSAQQHIPSLAGPGAPRGGKVTVTKLASAHFRPGCDSQREKKRIHGEKAISDGQGEAEPRSEASFLLCHLPSLWTLRWK